VNQQKDVFAFFDQVEKDAALQHKLRGLDTRDEAQVSKLLQIAAEAGYTFSAQDWKIAGRRLAEALQAKYWNIGEAELSDEELSAVTGGNKGEAELNYSAGTPGSTMIIVC
jgi:predicted ribosomally synthesized peptide with nif11-like leader